MQKRWSTSSAAKPASSAAKGANLASSAAEPANIDVELFKENASRESLSEALKVARRDAVDKIKDDNSCDETRSFNTKHTSMCFSGEHSITPDLMTTPQAVLQTSTPPLTSTSEKSKAAMESSLTQKEAEEILGSRINSKSEVSRLCEPLLSDAEYESVVRSSVRDMLDDGHFLTPTSSSTSESVHSLENHK